MADESHGKSSPRQHWHALAASFLGWALDAFDFFIVVFMVDVLAEQFHVEKSHIVWTLTATLVFRPLGAVVFGLLADRFGRRRPLMANVVYFSIIELLCGFAPNFSVFLLLRALFGIGMGGEWGVGASLTMETVPRRWRGFFSGVLQSGYPIGYLLAALAARFVLPLWGWRAMFWLAGAQALLALYIRAKVPESEAWRQHRAPTAGAVFRVAGKHWKTVAYMVALMTLMMSLSHGTQDLYPDFLKTEVGISAANVAYIAILYNVGAVLGSILFGNLSERLGRRRSLLAALGMSLLVIPLWAFGASEWIVALGAFLMQAGVQGAWGIIPAHLNELSPDAARGLVAGFAYQLGILFAAPVNNVEYWLRDFLGYRWALAGFEIAVILLLGVAVARGAEQHGKHFVVQPELID